MICGSKNSSKSLRLDCVKSLPLLFILGVCFQFFFFFAYFIVGMNVNVIRLVFHFLEYKQLLVSVIFAIYLRCAFCAGDNVIVGSREGKLCWFDMDLSSQPYRILKYVTAP